LREKFGSGNPKFVCEAAKRDNELQFAKDIKECRRKRHESNYSNLEWWVQN